MPSLPDHQLPATFNRLAWSNLAAQSAEQIALAAAPIVAVLLLGVGEGQGGRDQPGHDEQNVLSLSDWRFPIPFYMICIIHTRTGASWPTRPFLIAAAPRPEVSPTFLQIAVLAALAATGTLATNILLPSLPQMAASLKVSTASVTSAITIFLAVFAIGQLVVGPVSDRYGRRWPVLIGFAVFLAGSLWCGLSDYLPSLLIGRVIQATGACATSVLSRAIARDLFSGAALARAMALIMIAMAAAPGFSPLLGGALDHFLAGAPNLRSSRTIRGAGRHGLWHRVWRNSPLDPDTARSARDRPKPILASRRSPFPGSGRDRQLDHGRAVRDVFGGPPSLDRGASLHADPARAIFRRHRHGRVRRRHAGDAAGAALRARPLDPRRPCGGSRRQHRHPAGLELPCHVPAVPRRDLLVPAGHGHRQSPRHGAGAVAVWRKGRCCFGVGRLLADDGRGDRGLFGGDRYRTRRCSRSASC